MVMASLVPGSGSYRDPNDEFRIRAVDKRRTVEQALFRLEKAEQDCLYSLYGAVHIPHSVLRVFQDLAGPALCLPESKRLLKACDRQVLGKATPQDKLLFSATRISASKLKESSTRNYRKERHGQEA